MAVRIPGPVDRDNIPVSVRVKALAMRDAVSYQLPRKHPAAKSPIIAHSLKVHETPINIGFDSPVR